MDGGIQAKQEALQARLRQCGRLLVAYSGGIDSAYLAYVTHRVLGADMLAVMADSASLARSQYADALAFASEQGIPLHCDRHDVFILQMHGSKRWMLYDTPIELPMRGQTFRPEETPPGPVRAAGRGRPGAPVQDGAAAALRRRGRCDREARRLSGVDRDLVEHQSAAADLGLAAER